MPMGSLGILGGHRDIAKYLIHRVWILRGAHGDEGTDHDQWGHPEAATTPSTVEAACRIEHKVRWFGRQSGENIIANMRLFFATPSHPSGIGVEIGPQDRFLIDPPDDVDADDQKTYVIVARERHDGWSWTEDLGAHWEVWIA